LPQAWKCHVGDLMGLAAEIWGFKKFLKGVWARVLTQIKQNPWQ